MKSNDESAGETCTENFEIGKPCILNSVAGMTTSDSFSETAAGKAFSRASDACASEDNMVQLKSDSGRPLEANDDSSCVSGLDEHENGKASTEDSKVKIKTQNIIKVESSEDPPSRLQAGLCSQNPSRGQILQSKSIDAADNLLEVQNTLSQASNDKCQSHVQSLVDVKNDKPSDMKDGQLEESTEHSALLSPADMISSDPRSTVLNSIKENDDMELEHHPADETDDSDIVEQDVKVCDICGDTGREDLLAFCCRCSDGAEHTYCMREMMAKVPEGDWLCEECKNAKRVANGRQEKTVKLDENEKNNSSGQASSEHLNSSDVDGQRTKSSMRTSKRRREDADSEVSSIAKKPTLDSIVGSPKTNSSKPAALSRENSAKNLDKGRLQSLHHSSSVIAQVNDAAEPAISASDPRPHAFRGTFSKSNSFNSLNSKPKVKLVDQVVIQRQKSSREYGSSRLKEGVVRSIGKSMSFKSTNSSQPDSKLKTVSPRLSDIQDIKNMKQKSPFDLQRFSRAEHSSVNSMKGVSVSPTSKNETKRTVSRGESSVATANHHEMKPLHSEGKAAALSRSSSFAARRTSDSSSSLGEFKRPSTLGHNAPGISSTNGVNNSEKKLIQSSVKEEMPACVSAERPPIIANEIPPDGLTRPKDSTNVGERLRESSGSRIVPPSVKSSREDSDKLKAAIEVAMIKKPGMYRKPRAIAQSDDSSVPVSAGKKRLSCDAELPDHLAVSRSLNVDSIAKETTNNVKKLPISVEGVPPSGGQNGVPISPSPGDMISNVAAASPLLLKSFAIPEHEYTWQGCFEIYRGGKLVVLWDGLQAHLSTRASPKAVEAASQFESRLVLCEVPRLSTWPMHFQEYGATEDSIALFFFAKDLESYDKIYKVLLDNMMKNDLALKGNVNGVELLIFPSSQLPDNSKRWNMLFFLWGVFRGKKENHLQQITDSVKQFGAIQDIPQPIMSLTDNRCSQRPAASEDAVPMLSEPTSEKLQTLLSPSPVNGDFGTNVYVMDQTGHGINSTSSDVVQHDTKVDSQEIKNPSQEGGINTRSIPPLGSMRASSCSGREQELMQTDIPPNRLQPLHQSASGTIKDVIGGGTVLNKTCIQNQVKPKIDSRDPAPMYRETSMESEWFPRDLNVEPDKWKECVFPIPYVVPQTQYGTANQVPLRNDEMRETLKTVNHIPSATDTLQNQRKVVSMEALIRERNENAERHFFPIDSQPVKGMHLADGAMPWKMHVLEQEQLSDRVPNLELALGAEKGPRALDIQPSLLNKLEQKVKEEPILKVAGPKVEDDVSATLSLSLSFPFPEKELGAGPATKTGQLKSEREHTNKSMLLFGNLGDN